MTVAAAPGVRAPRIGESAPRPDGAAKVQGRFAFSSDLWAEGMLWGATLRAPHPSARIRSIDIAPALAMAGVHAVLTHADVPGSPYYGLERRDQPVFARDVVRYHGEPIAAVAADHPEVARRACAAIAVDYEVMAPVTDAERALHSSPLHPDGNLFRSLSIRHGDVERPIEPGAVSVEGTYEVGLQDQAFLGVESGLAIPGDDGGVELYISTQFLHVDREQVAACLGLPEHKVKLVLAGVGGAFGGREDVSLQIHLCLLALHTARPVKMVYSREESFFGHVHRHPAKMWYRHTARPDGTLLRVDARVVLDGGAYASTSSAVLANASCFAAGPYRVPVAAIDGYAVRTNNPPCGAMRGFGAVQTCFAHEAQMDRLAQALDLDPVELRRRNVLAPGDTLITGQRLTGTAPVRELLDQLAAFGLPTDRPREMLELPGGAGRTADAGDVKRGVGVAIGFKNLMFSEGYDDYSTARCVVDGGVVAIHCACAEVGQGFVTLAQQIARETLGLDRVVLAPADTTIGSAGSTSASRQTWMSGGAVWQACLAVRAHILADIARTYVTPIDRLVWDGERVLLPDTVAIEVARFISDRHYDETAEYHHAPTFPLDAHGQGDAHVSFAFAAHRAVVDVDPELGLVRVIEVATTQDVGKVLNPLQALGQIEGGIAQGVGLAVMEEIVLDEGRIRNASFTDYLLPTALDMPTVEVVALIEEPEPGAPFGAKGIGEPPTISSTAAVVAAIRNATGCALTRVPVRPDDIVFGRAGD